jgi:hypothetical protein
MGVYIISRSNARLRGAIDIQAYIWYYMVMKRTALFLKEEQINKLQKLSDKTGAPVAELVRRAIDKYLKERAKELK